MAVGFVDSVLVLALVVAFAAPVVAGEPLLVVQERRTRPASRAARKVEHVATVKNTSPHAVRAVRVTVEARDRSGKVLWKTVKRGPSALAPGESASISVTAPDLGPDATIVYRFDARGDPRRPRSR